MALVELEVRDNVGILILNDHAKRNSLSESLVDALLAGLAQLNTQKIPVVILRSPDGCKVWSAGHNIQELPHTQRDPLGYEDPLERLLRAVQEYPGPVIAMVQGSVWGGACDLAMTAQHSRLPLLNWVFPTISPVFCIS